MEAHARLNATLIVRSSQLISVSCLKQFWVVTIKEVTYQVPCKCVAALEQLQAAVFIGNQCGTKLMWT